jgi:hypothetical protein
MKKILGIALIASPFIWITIQMVRNDGWRSTIWVWSRTLATIAIVTLGAYLLIS